MLRRLLLAVLLLSTAFACQYIHRDYYPPGPAPDRIILNLTERPAERVAVSWRTAPGVDRSLVQVTVADPAPNLEVNARTLTGRSQTFSSDLNTARYHSAILDSLQPATQYAYRVGDSEHWSEWNHFTTAAADAAPFSFLYFGDAQNGLKSLWSRAIRGAYAKMPAADFLLHAGDLINQSTRDQEWGEWFYAGGWIHAVTPSIATPGNHEYGNKNDGIPELSPHWHPTFTLPENGPAEFPETAYSIDYQGTRIISLDSPAFLYDSAAAAVQVAWLEGLLAENPNPWTIVFMHHPVFSSTLGRDNDELRMLLEPLFVRYGVDLVLQGHDHTYGRGTNLNVGEGARPTVDGPIYVVSVSGPKMYDVGLEPWMDRAASNTQLYQLVSLNGDSLEYQAYTVTGELYDAFSLYRQGGGGPNVYIDRAPTDTPERLELIPRYERNYSDEEREAYRNRFEAYQARKRGKEGQ